ncbi:aa3-type cytochrome c oxidase subunit IV [Belnapia rosea]|uniref:Aa3 type cytochrome c oxidase subunit IV n=1 Tax=Belnapia rosea TaxID=938405 RepID=A0A1G6Y199_9PROT|nr:aa3-type cytochrome c oxidase subunit IV [Belnapia rosea]SDB72784.1 aa3 type cytochrome c oxidase subunit IV [Belnapia rosea]SDD84100.1 aa3 type cytochrome c oxidase subunit IV [Belnapia rosea]
MAEHQQNYEFGGVDDKALLADRQRGWDGFVQFSTWGIVITVLLLLALLLFVA